MKKNSNQINDTKATQMSLLFWTVSILHYLSGICGLAASIIMATSDDNVTKTHSAILAIICIIIFAAIQPDSKYRKLETGWRILDKKLNRYP